METIKKSSKHHHTLDYTTWQEIKQKFPDRFVLIENPIYDTPGSLFPRKGILRYKNKSKLRVAEKANELDIDLMTILYTGGRLEEQSKDCIFVI